MRPEGEPPKFPLSAIGVNPVYKSFFHNWFLFVFSDFYENLKLMTDWLSSLDQIQVLEQLLRRPDRDLSVIQAPLLGKGSSKIPDRPWQFLWVCLCLLYIFHWKPKNASKLFVLCTRNWFVNHKVYYFRGLGHYPHVFRVISIPFQPVFLYLRNTLLS